MAVGRTARQVICGCLLSSMVLTFESTARKSFLESTTLQDKQMKRQKYEPLWFCMCNPRSLLENGRKESRILAIA